MIRQILSVLIILAAANPLALSGMLGVRQAVNFVTLLAMAAFLLVNIRPIRSCGPTRRLRQLETGSALLGQFLVSAAASVILQCALWMQGTENETFGGMAVLAAAASILWCVLAEGIVFWNGMIRVYLTSVQLGIKTRILAALVWWIPGVNIWYLMKIMRLTGREAELETEKWELDEVRAESEICKTRYPILLVHGVFFRDFKYLNYWGRIPRELKRNGAQVFYGQQQSAASVEDSGRELAARIRQIMEETGCQQVNIIAHSKGGLDARAAIAHCGMASCVATLTTINTPHRGCVFAEYLLNHLPDRMVRRVADTYNAAARHLGDAEPDFMAAVQDLTASACESRNRITPDNPGVVYESVMSVCHKARSGRFPLNMTYRLVNYFDGPNDGLVAVDSAEWGSRFTLLEPAGRRGISHGDVIDLNRENIPGFDVREFYVQLAAGLKDRGY